MGIGAFSDSPPGISGDNSGQSDESTDARPQPAKAPAELQPDPSSAESHEGRLRWDDYSQKTATHADNVRAFEQEKRDWYADNERNAQAAPALPAPTALAPAAADDGYAIVSEIAMRSGMDANEERAARGLLDIARAGFEQEIAGLKQLQTDFAEVKQTAAQAADGVKSQTTERMRAQLSEAIDIFGGDKVQKAVPITQILLDRGTINEATRKPYTVSEATAMVHGTTIEDAKQARQANGHVRRQARNPAVATGNTTAPVTAANGEISVAEAHAIIQSTL
jgi:hypothetical protein